MRLACPQLVRLAGWSIHGACSISRLHDRLREWQNFSRPIVAQGSPLQYEPLENDKSFRLLKLASTKREVCQLQHFPLNEPPKYIALSYTWGSPLLTDESIAGYNKVDRPFALKAGGVTMTMSISRNLSEALSYIIDSRSRHVLKSPDYIWADGICINQNDPAEREVQVPLMGEIYSNCEIAMVWLGQDETDLEGFLSIHSLLEPIIRQREIPGSSISKRFGSAWTLQDLASVLGNGILDPGAWAAYVGFYEKRRWFSRVWVAQEVALPRTTIILCGDAIFPWDIVQMVKDFLRDSLAMDLQDLRTVHRERPAGYEIATMSRLRNFMTVSRMSTGSSTLGGLYPILHDRTGATTRTQLSYAVLHESLTTVRSLDSERGHDKVYGVIGIFAAISGKEIDDLLRPNYGRTVQEVFTRVTWLLLRELPNLSILSSVEDASQRRLEGLPSWVPDWTSAITNNSLVSMLSPSSNASMVAEAYQGYRKETDSSLVLNGALFDTIADFARSPQFSDEVDMFERNKGPAIALESALELCMNPDAPVAINLGTSAWEMLWRTMIANRTSSLVNLPVMTDYFAHYTTRVLANHKTNYGVDALYIRTTGRLQQFQRLNGINPVATGLEDTKHGTKAEMVNRGHLAFTMLSGEVTIRRRLFRTRGGHLGLGPLSMEKNDQIWLMDGAHYPLLLRPTLDKHIFTFVGDLYLHGHMNGEMLRGGLRHRFQNVTIK